MIGNDQKYLKKRTTQIMKIQVLGQVTDDNSLIKHYDKCDILILPSYEAYPQVILEVI